ncbi:MAG: porin [Actinobacteria bacterium 13_2_20CM_2_71_6]|nr:MAG: porin [Actinobacteria bacterium 13_2_20CM_2_71_6]
MRKYATEFIGTFFLVFTICVSVQSGPALAPLAIGVVLAAMVFAGGHISGAHYNPAVTVAVWIRGRLAAREVGPYIAAQVAGAVVAAGIVRTVLGLHPAAAFQVTGRHLVAAFAAELLVTFALAYVVLNVATSKDHPNNSFYGLAIGFTVMSGAVGVGGISGGVFNPAVAFGVSTAGMVSWSMLWVYLVANLAAGALAGVAFRALNPADLEVPQPVEELEGETASRSLPMSGFKKTRTA